MCTANGEIIIISDDESDEDGEGCVSIMEDVKKSGAAPSPCALDEDLVVTYSRRAPVLPHARYDCPVHPFKAVYCEVEAPVATNELYCDQCFCYICDKPASSCLAWRHSDSSHCDSHNKSDNWNKLRSRTLLGGLHAFNLTLSEADAYLRHADMLLQSFKQELAARLHSYMVGRSPAEHTCPENPSNMVHNYTPVFELVQSFLDKADEQEGRAAAVMRLGAAEEFMQHCQAARTFILQSPMANATKAKLLLLHRVISSLQKQIVLGDFTPEFTCKLQKFYSKLHFPAELKSLRNSLCIRSWDDVLLVSVLKGQNVSGVRRDRSKKDVLNEHMSVVLLRAEELQRQHRYRELCRYLRVVQTGDSNRLHQLQDLVPFFLCMEGDFKSALDSLFPAVSAPASRLTPSLFLTYLCVFDTARAPKLVVSHPKHICSPDAAWEPIQGAVPLSRDALVKFALRAQGCCSAVFNDSECWSSLLTMVSRTRGSRSALPVPSPQFLEEAKELVKTKNVVLHQHRFSSLQLYSKVYPDQGLILLVTGALVKRICDSALTPALPVMNSLKENAWALEWLWDNLSQSAERFSSFLQEITQEMANTAASPDTLQLYFPPSQSALQGLTS